MRQLLRPVFGKSQESGNELLEPFHVASVAVVFVDYPSWLGLLGGCITVQIPLILRGIIF